MLAACFALSTAMISPCSQTRRARRRSPRSVDNSRRTATRSNAGVLEAQRQAPTTRQVRPCSGLRVEECGSQVVPRRAVLLFSTGDGRSTGSTSHGEANFLDARRCSPCPSDRAIGGTPPGRSRGRHRCHRVIDSPRATSRGSARGSTPRSCTQSSPHMTTRTGRRERSLATQSEPGNRQPVSRP